MRRSVFGLLALMLVSSCSKKEEPRQVAPVKVRTTVVAPASEGGSQGYSGTIEEESGTSLSFASIGTVQRIAVGEGQFVKQGQLVGVLDATAARNAYEAALATKEQALDAQERMKLLHDNGSLPDIKWIEVQTQVRQALASEQIAKKGQDDTRLVAPFSGFVAQKSVEAGANVAPGTPVVRLVKIDRVKVKISVPEEEIARFAVGQKLAVTVAALGGHAFEATVTERGVSADPLSRSYEVKGVIQNPRHELLPGMVTEVRCESGLEPKDKAKVGTVALPANVVLIDADNKPFVWTVADGKARRTYVTLGENVGASVVVADGLKAGDKVIVEGQQKVSTGMEIEELKN